MSGLQRVLNYTRAHPIAIYIGGGIFLHLLRNQAVNAAYRDNFIPYDVERQRELERFMADGTLPQLTFNKSK